MEDQSTSSGKSSFSNNNGYFQVEKKSFFKFFRTPVKYQRLESAIIVFRRDLEQRLQGRYAPGVDTSACGVCDLLDLAWKALIGRQYDKGGRLFHAAQQQSVYLLNDDELAVKAQILTG